MTISEWVHTDDLKGFEESMLDKVSSLQDEDQVMFLRKIVELHNYKILSLSTGKLTRIISNHENINIGVYIIIKWLCNYKKHNKGLTQNQIYDIFRVDYKIVDSDQLRSAWDKFCNTGLLSACHGAAKLSKYKENDPSLWSIRIVIMPDDSSYLQFEPVTATRKGQEVPYNEFAKYIKSEIPGYNYNTQYKYWEIDAKFYNQLIQMLTRYRHKFNSEMLYTKELNDYGSIVNLFYNWKNYTLEMYTFTSWHPCDFCEGKKYPKHKLLNVEYHWCKGQSFINCSGMKSSDCYKTYTLYDIAAILNIQIQNTSFIHGSFNNLGELLPHLHCKECNHLLEPIDTDYLAARRITMYHCANNSCSKQNEQIYINHCFERDCRNVIDSRDSSKCDNDFVICNKCGVCCSSMQFEKRRLAGNLSKRLLKLLQDNAFHLDNKKFFCPKCGKLLKDRTITTDNGKTLHYKCCEEHSEHRGIFPLWRKENIENNKLLKKLLAKQG